MVYFEVGDIIFYESKTFVGKIIRMITKSPFSHVAMAINSEEIVEANFMIRSRKVKFVDTEYKRIKVMRTKEPLTIKQKTFITANSRRLLGRGYDYLGVFLLFLKIVFRVRLDTIKDDVTKLWCSELVDYLYGTIGIDLVPQTDNHYVTITDLEESPELYEAFQQVYEEK